MGEDQERPGDMPIKTPEAVGPEYVWERDPLKPHFLIGYVRKVIDLVKEPAHWFRENVVEPNRGPKYYWYHRKYARALPVDECYMDDLACIQEADIEYKRMHMVDRATLELLRYRRDHCNFWNLTTKDIKAPSENCKDITETFEREEINFFIKYRDLHYNHNVIHAYNKQKHRMIMERRRALKEEAERVAQEQEQQSEKVVE